AILKGAASLPKLKKIHLTTSQVTYNQITMLAEYALKILKSSNSPFQELELRFADATLLQVSDLINLLKTDLTKPIKITLRASHRLCSHLGELQQVENLATSLIQIEYFMIL